MEKFRDLAISTQVERFQAGIQPPLLFVESAGEQDNRRPKFIGDEAGRNVSGAPLRQHLPSPQLPLPGHRIGSAVKIQAGDRLPVDAILLDQPQQWFLNRHVEDVLQFGSEIARRGQRDAGLRSGQQRTVTRKPN